MRSDITIVFDTRRSLDLNATVEPSPQRQSDARDWFDSAWETLGCEPLRPSGKVLLLDKVLGVADALGYDVLSPTRRKRASSPNTWPWRWSARASPWTCPA